MFELLRNTKINRKLLDDELIEKNDDGSILIIHQIDIKY